MILMLFVFLLGFSSEEEIRAKIKKDLNFIAYDSIRIDGDLYSLTENEWVPNKPFHPGNNLIKVKFGKRYKMVQIKIRIFKKVFRTKSYIRKSSPVLPTQVEYQMRDITRVKNSIAKITDIFAYRSIAAGEILTESNTREKYDAFFGEKINVEYKINNLFIKIEGKLLKNAYKGQKVRIELKNGKKIYAILKAKGIASYENF
jgi:flagella basal body P-ring formation protein FlgA